MADAAVQPATQRYALVTGANKGIGFEICRQLASKGIVVILASRDEKRGTEAQEKLKEFDNHVVFHQLDVVDPASVAAVVEFIRNKFGRLDILVNNAAILGVEVEGDESVLAEFLEAEVVAIRAGRQQEAFHPTASGSRVTETLKGAEECIQTNYYGVKRVTEAFIPLLQLSPSPRIVNVSSGAGSLMLQPNEWVRGVLGSEEGLTEDRVDEVVQKFISSFREGSLEEKQCWPRHLAAYKVSKAALNAYTRIIAKEWPSLVANAVCPGYCRTDITGNSGLLTAAEGAEGPVKFALLHHGGPSGYFFSRTESLS